METGARDRLVRRLVEVAGSRYVLSDPYELRIYQYDASPETALPDVVVIPASAEEVAQVVKICSDEGVPIVSRSGATGLSGGCVPIQGGVALALSRLNRILELDYENLRAVVEPAVVNLTLSLTTRPAGFYYAPDPASQAASTIGGNVGTNAGGPHTLIYGVTVNHVTGLEVALASGELIQVGGRKTSESTGYDLTGILVGSEGTMAVVTKIWVKLMPVPPVSKTLLAVYPDVPTASEAVSGVVAKGILPAAIEMMDNPSIQAVEAATHAGYPTDAGAVLLLEVDGIREVAEDLTQQMVQVCKQYGAQAVRVAKDEAERQALWRGRKAAFSAMGRLAPDFYVMDGVVPRTKLPEVLRAIEAISARTGYRIANVFHAGDGNLHPLVLFDAFKPGQYEEVLEIGNEVLKLCADVGGSITGEHGIGLEKRHNMRYIFSEDDLQVMHQVRHVFDPEDRMNPGKIFPVDGEAAPKARPAVAGRGTRAPAGVAGEEEIWI